MDATYAPPGAPEFRPFGNHVVPSAGTAVRTSSGAQAAVNDSTEAAAHPDALSAAPSRLHNGSAAVPQN
jgi:hypothetical protein